MKSLTLTMSRIVFGLLTLLFSLGTHASGWVDGVNIVGTDFRAWGWVCDRAVPNTPVNVHIWRDDNVFLGAVPAAITREAAVGAACGGNSTHGFYAKITIPQNLLDYKNHAILFFVVGGPSPNEKLSTNVSLQFSGLDTAKLPQNPGDVVGRDYLGSYVGHLGVWDGTTVIQMTGAKAGVNPTISKETIAHFNLESKPWGAVNARIPGSIKVKKCFQKQCNYEFNQENVSGAIAVAKRAQQIFLIGADYTSVPFYRSAREGKGLAGDVWPALRGSYRCDTLVVDSYAVMAPWYTGADLWPRVVTGTPSNWNTIMSNIMRGNYLPRSVFDSIKASLG